MNWLLLFIPIAIALESFAPERHQLVFLASAFAIVPLAGWMRRATEQLAARLGEGVGGLLSATFGNAAELIIAFAALRVDPIHLLAAVVAGCALLATRSDPRLSLLAGVVGMLSLGGLYAVGAASSAKQASAPTPDTGHGIDADQIGKIFKPYHTTKKNGTGLGLMIVQRIIREHGGTIELESHPGRGTTFRIRLPLREKRTRLLEGPPTKPRPA